MKQLDRYEDEQEEMPPDFSLGKKAAIFAPTALLTMGLPALLHAPLPAEIFGLVGAVALAANSPKIYAEMRDYLPVPVTDLFDGMQERRQNRAEKGEWSTLDRFFGRHLHGSMPVQEERGVGPTRKLEEVDAVPGMASEAVEEWDETWYQGDDEDAMPAQQLGMFTFSQLLAQGFRPSLRRIFLARLSDETDIFVEAKDLCHVALAGVTGNGKSSLMRLILAQLCIARVRILMLNPHYMPYEHASGEDWTPFEPYLEKPPGECADYRAIRTYLQWVAETLLPRRIERGRAGHPIGKPFFLVLDELPAIVAEIREAPEWIAKILREGRKFGIFLVVAAQDFLAKTVASDGEGAIRKLYRTAFYVGGDGTTAKTLLDMPANQIPETDLGKGIAMLRCAATKKAVMVQVPYCDNESLYYLLGPSTFVEGSQRAMNEDELAPSGSPSQASSITPSQDGNSVYLFKPSSEADRRSGEGGEGAEGEKVVLSELEMHIGKLFFEGGLNPNAIVREIWPEIKGGDAYQKHAAMVADTIRKYVDTPRVQKGS